MSKNDNLITLQLKGITKQYGQGNFLVDALKGVDLNFRKSEFVSILGPSGCGKTTLLNIIGGLDRYTCGDLIIKGKSTKNYKDRDWDGYRNNSIGFVFQSYNLIPHQTVLGNVELALELSGIKKNQRRQKALSILEKVGLKGQENKKPNQLSGGQMQRVAIARALINDPEIILADEPTGALDTQTSIQVMDLLKEIAKDRLVIMVTHNPDLAKKYSTRIISLLDGLVTNDTNPLIDGASCPPKQNRKPKMGHKTAFLLSLKNLFSKRTRTILTSVAGSIGITGVALVLALSNGFNGYMARMQTDTLASYPLTISESSVDLTNFANIYENEAKEKYPELDNILVEKAFDNLTGMLKNNKLNDKSENGFTNYLEKVDKDLIYSISYNYGFDMNDYFYTDIKLNGQNTFMAIDMLVGQIQRQFDSQLQTAIGVNTSFIRQYIPTIQEMPDSKELINQQYDVLKGRLPEKAEEIVLVVDEYNGLSDISLALLGYIGVNFNGASSTEQVKFDEIDNIDLGQIIGDNAKKIYLAKNSQMYFKSGNTYFPNNAVNFKDEMTELSIVGILRCKENTSGILQEGFAYLPSLTQKVIEENIHSEIVDETRNSQTQVASIYTIGLDGKPVEYEKLSLRQLAGVDTPSQINIYAKDFESKEEIKAYIDKWNDKYEGNEELQITYSDMMSMMFGMLTTMVDAVTYVLIAFTSISLVVSSVMIGIITYISVVERTKEIGVLRALGASKREISSVFNAETFIIGLLAGLIGVGATYLICLPINAILSKLIPSVGKLAILSPISALILTVISIALTLVSGLIPSNVAAKKDPVVALRSE